MAAFEGYAVAGTDIAINVPSQGVDLLLPKEAALAWIDQEMQFVNEMSLLMNENVQWADRAYSNQGMHQNSVRTLQGVRQAFVKGDLSALNGYLEDARTLQLVLGIGSLGERARGLLKRGAKEEARWLLLIYGSKWTNGTINSVLEPFRAAAMGHPAYAATTDIISAESAKKRATEAQAQSQERADELESLLKEKNSLFKSLEELYREKLTVAEPAAFWEQLAAKKKWAWRFWLAIFGILAVLLPLFIAWLTWEPLTIGIARITNTGNSVISISALATITIPALLYGWVLKNVGRIFLQNLMLADDAEHRRALSLTYLGLMANPKHGMEREDRAIILNALFRPIPPHSGEEGPPSGLVELIKGKSS